MYTKVRAAFRMKIQREGKKMQNKGLMNVAFRMSMDRTNTVSTFYELGMTDPFNIQYEEKFR